MTARAPPAPTTRVEPLRIWVHVLVAVTAGLISPFTVFAWPFALLVGMVLGSADARRRRGEHGGAAESVATGLIAAFGAIAMLFFGAIIGGVIAIAVVVLAIFSERAAAFASPTDRGVARIILFVIPILMWVIVFPLLGDERRRSPRELTYPGDGCIGQWMAAPCGHAHGSDTDDRSSCCRIRPTNIRPTAWPIQPTHEWAAHPARWLDMQVITCLSSVAWVTSSRRSPTRRDARSSTS